MVCLPLFQCREIGDITDNAQSEVIANNNIKYASNPSLNILFSAWFGGMSHARPQLQMADILVERGHRVTFASFDNVLDLWLADHPNITPYGIGKDTHDTAELKAIMWDYMMKEYDLQSLATKEMLELLIIKFYKKHFQLFHDWIVTNKPDVVVCDFFVSGCYDAAYETGTPFVITSNMLSYQDMEHAPYLSDLMSYLPSTHETTGFLDRFYDKLIRPALYYWDLRNTTQLRNSIAAELNISTYEFMADRWKQGFVLVNNFFGLEIPRALSPNVFLVGPCMPRNYPPLSDELKLFLGNHKRTVYVGFGSNMILSSWRMTLLLRSLISAHADGLIDGVVWGLMNTATAGDHIPTSLTIDGTVHTISDMRSGKHLFIRMMDRAPQRAVLEHPSTILFITHCGIASIYETMFAGVPILGLPIFGDQPSNAIRMYEHGAGLWLRRSETNEKHSVMHYTGYYYAIHRNISVSAIMLFYFNEPSVSSITLVTMLPILLSWLPFPVPLKHTKLPINECHGGNRETMTYTHLQCYYYYQQVIY
ncbi:hypothetical protein BDF22DRAFT_615911 [Syncephalis plumigaleata]|nr:hypothetical protein BDF22DRAFT_615911 [Syncephalis plumigaleata]